MHFIVNFLLPFQVTEALTLVIKLAEYLAKLPKVRIKEISHHNERPHCHIIIIL